MMISKLLGRCDSRRTVVSSEKKDSMDSVYLVHLKRKIYDYCTKIMNKCQKEVNNTQGFRIIVRF